MVDAWPVSLPHCLPLDGYAEAVADNLIRAAPDTGPAKVRRRSTSQVRPLSGMIVIDRTQLATLRTFVETTLLGGALPFTLPAQSAAGDLLVRFAQGGLPQWGKVAASRFNVSFQLEILP